MGRGTKLILLLAGVGVVLSAAIMLSTDDPEPVYEGRKLSYWCERYYRDSDFSPLLEQYPPAKAINHIGTNAFPFLLQWIAYNPPHWRSRLSHAPKPWSGWIPEWVTVQAGNLRANTAAAAFRPLGPAARPAIPRLVELARHPNDTIANRAVFALAYVGPDALPEFAAMVTDATLSPELHRRGVWGLRLIETHHNITVADLGTNAAPVVTALLSDLNHQYADLAGDAAELLASLKPEFQHVLGALTNALRDPRINVRWGAVRVLERYGPEAAAAVPALVTALSDSEFDMREAATNALMRIAPQALTNSPAQ